MSVALVGLSVRVILQMYASPGNMDLAMPASVRFGTIMVSLDVIDDEGANIKVHYLHWIIIKVPVTLVLFSE